MTPIHTAPPGLVLLPKALHGSECTTCHAMHARWGILQAEGEPPVPHCAACLFYATPWGEEHRESLDALVRLRENFHHVAYARTEGRVTEIEPLDCVLGGVMVTLRVRARAEARG